MFPGKDAYLGHPFFRLLQTLSSSVFTLHHEIERMLRFKLNGVVILSVCTFVITYILYVHEANFAKLSAAIFKNEYDYPWTDAQILGQKIRILCWVMTAPKNHRSKCVAVKETWGRHCNKIIFMSSKTDPSIGSVALPNVSEGRDFLWAKTKEAFKWIWAHHQDDFDWVMKADDDTYVIVENLRFMLKDFNTNTPIFFGCKFQPNNVVPWVSGGAGYVLSREAIRRFVEVGLPNATLCRKEANGNEDQEISRCLLKLGVKLGDSRDKFGKQRFMPFTPEHHVTPGEKDPSFWYWRYLYFFQEQGIGCCSETSVSFHYVPPRLMYVLEFLLYYMRPHGVTGGIRTSFLGYNDEGNTTELNSTGSITGRSPLSMTDENPKAKEKSK